MGNDRMMVLNIEPCDCEVCRTALGAFFQLLGQKIASGDLAMDTGQLQALVVEGHVELVGSATFAVPN